MLRRTFLIGAALLGAGCATLPTPMSASFSSDRISVITEGSGPDVLLIHGLTSSRELWRETAAAVPGYRYHLIQINGFAGNPAAGNAGFGPLLAPVAEEVARYIEEAALDRPALIGHSMGGSLAMMVAARHPDLIGKLMVVDMLPFMGILFGPPGTTAESLRPLAEQSRARMAASAGEERRKTIETTIATMVKDPARRAEPIVHALTSDPAVAARGMHDLLTTDLRPELAAIDVPVTVLYVRAPNSPIDEAQFAAIYQLSFTNTPQAKLKRIPDSYHFIMLDQPSAFQAEVRSFLAE